MKSMNLRDGPVILVMAPTRELAVQINQEFLRFVDPKILNTVCVFGGSSKAWQLREIRKVFPITSQKCF